MNFLSTLITFRMVLRMMTSHDLLPMILLMSIAGASNNFQVITRTSCRGTFRQEMKMIKMMRRMVMPKLIRIMKRMGVVMMLMMIQMMVVMLVVMGVEVMRTAVLILAMMGVRMMCELMKMHEVHLNCLSYVIMELIYPNLFLKVVSDHMMDSGMDCILFHLKMRRMMEVIMKTGMVMFQMMEYYSYRYGMSLHLKHSEYPKQLMEFHHWMPSERLMVMHVELNHNRNRFLDETC